MEIRFTAWLIWRIHLAFRQMGVGGGMGAQCALVFLKSIPFGVVLELAQATQEAFNWLADHFPDVGRENPGLRRCVLKRPVMSRPSGGFVLPCCQSWRRPLRSAVTGWETTSQILVVGIWNSTDEFLEKASMCVVRSQDIAAAICLRQTAVGTVLMVDAPCLLTSACLEWI